jgi:hypothetical protein
MPDTPHLPLGRRQNRCSVPPTSTSACMPTVATSGKSADHDERSRTTRPHGLRRKFPRSHSTSLSACSLHQLTSRNVRSTVPFPKTSMRSRFSRSTMQYLRSVTGAQNVRPA